MLVDDDLLFEDGPGAPRPLVAVNQWLRELPASGAPSPATWEAYALSTVIQDDDVGAGSRH